MASARAARDHAADEPGAHGEDAHGHAAHGEDAHGPVLPGSGWPGDEATATTPVASDAIGVRTLAATAGSLTELTARQSVCRACPRLVAWREEVAATRRRSFADQRYWGRPVPGWGADEPRVLIVGLAPAAHGGNRTGRIFTGDRSGDVLFESLWRCGLAAQPTSTSAGDGQQLLGARMLAAVRCAPPENKPSITERDTCGPWLAAEFALVRPSVAAIVCLGHFAWQAVWRELSRSGYGAPSPRPAFGHGVCVEAVLARGDDPPEPPGVLARGDDPPDPPGVLARGDGSSDPPGVLARGDGSSDPPEVLARGGALLPGGHPRASDGPEPPAVLLVLGCYHPSQQNTFTGRVTPAMLDAVFERARRHAGLA